MARIIALVLFSVLPGVLFAQDGGPDPELLKRSAGYGSKRFDANVLHPEDGYDEQEAFAFLEFSVLGAIDVHRVPVQRYDRPVLEGDAWRMDVHVAGPRGPVVESLRLDRLTGICRGGSWNGGSGFGPGGTVDLGSAIYAIEAGGGEGYRIALRHKRASVHPTDQEKQAIAGECRRDALRALSVVQHAFPGRFADAAEGDIIVEEATLISEVGELRGAAQVAFTAILPLRER